MKIFNSSQVKEIDQRTIIEEPITSFRLMERASLRFVQWFEKQFDLGKPVIIFAGSGNNGGDALAISRLLIERHFQLRVYLVPTSTTMSEDCQANFKALNKYLKPELLNLNDVNTFPKIAKNEVVIDGIFGSGLNRPIEEPVSSLIRYINKNSGCVVSIDIPSGLFAEDNRENNPENCIKADYTVSFEFPFLSFFMEENAEIAENVVVVPIGLHKDAVESTSTNYFTIDKEMIRSMLIPRKKFSHKGSYGHALIIAGRHGMMGAAVLAGKASLRGGAGLTTVGIPAFDSGILQTAVPEALIQIDKSDTEFSNVPELDGYQAIACGPAIGKTADTAEALHELIQKAKVPLVLDADALNILAEHIEWMKFLPAGSIITPHPKEFDRLAGVSGDMYSRHLKQLEFAKQFQVIVVLKGAHTIISAPDGNSYINTSGNPGMASGGTGDVLTGLLVSLIAQGYTSLNASLISVFVHGFAGDIVLETSSVEALIAGDIIENFGKAFRRIKEN